MALNYSQAWTLIKDLIVLFEDLDKFGHTTATTFLTRYAAVIAANGGIFPANVLASLNGYRASLGSNLGPGVIRGLISAALDEMMVAINAPEAGVPTTSIQQKWYRLWRYMAANSEAIQTQGYIRGVVTASGSVVGTGAVSRLSVDCYGHPLEGSYAETKTIECVADQQTVERHSELLQIRGTPREPSLLQVIGSGIRRSMKCFTTRDSDGFVTNATFSAYGGATAPAVATPATPATVTDIPGWILDSVTGVTVVTGSAVAGDLVYRDLPTENNKFALRFSTSRYIYQQVNTQRRPVFSELQPIYYQVAIYRESSCDGTLTLTLGASTFAVDVTTLNNAAWNIVKLTADKRCWLTNFTADQVLVKIALSGQSTGAIRIDDVIVTNWVALDGQWWAPVGGATPFLKGDLFTVTDSVNATRGVLSYWLNFRADLERRYSLPTAPKAPSGTIAVALAGAGSGLVENGAHTYGFTYVDVYGVESGISATAVATVIDKTSNGKVSVSSIAVGPTTVTASRKVYRSTAGTTTPLKLLTTIADNTTTVYTDNIADASLGATAPAGVTVADPT